MIDNFYAEFDEIMNLQKQIINSAGEKYNELLENVEKNISETKYGTQNEGFPFLVQSKSRHFS